MINCLFRWANSRNTEQYSVNLLNNHNAGKSKTWGKIAISCLEAMCNSKLLKGLFENWATQHFLSLRWNFFERSVFNAVNYYCIKSSLTGRLQCKRELDELENVINTWHTCVNFSITVYNFLLDLIGYYNSPNFVNASNFINDSSCNKSICNPLNNSFELFYNNP